MNELLRALEHDPLACVDQPYDSLHDLPREALEAFHLRGIRQRFRQLRGSVGVLDRLATEQGIEDVTTLDEAVALLFPHTVYKSYPLSILERGQFDRLTRWLQGLTATNLSHVDVKGIDSIDGWVAAMDVQTEMRLLHTFGTTGKLSFIPRMGEHWVQSTTLTAHAVRDWPGRGTGPDLMTARLPMVQPGYRYGAGATYGGVEQMVKLWAGGEDNALFLYPDSYFSADIASLAGRLRAAEARGEQGQVSLSPGLLARREEFAKREQQRPERMKEFLQEAIRRYGGRDICLFGVWPILFEWAEQGLAAGMKGLFGAGGQLMSGGGSKGRVLPPDHREQIFEFLGFSRVFEIYSMSELMVGAPRCEHGNYHFPAVLVPFVLDPETGKMLPRSGTQTGRFACFDMLPGNYWGGLVTGDEVTMAGWDAPCDCGRRSPYVHGTIRRYSEMQGGDDKINCAGAPEAHDRAVDFLLSSA